jgi:lipopolysaccharide biosynthesis protein
MKQDKLAVSVWLYHTDLWPELYSLLYPFKDQIKLYIGLCKDNNNTAIIADIESQQFDHIVSYHDNYGADIQCFLHHLNYLITEPHFLKIHTKKSMWGVNLHVNWRTLLWHGLLGSSKIFDHNISQISQNNIGAVCHPNMLLSNRESYHQSQLIVLCNILDINYTKICNGPFMAGNMFVGKTTLYKKYFASSSTTYNAILNKLMSETKKVNENSNGTFCHALERLFGYIIPYTNHIFGTTQFSNEIKIYNKKLDKYLNLIETHDSHCYLLEDPNVYGQILFKNNGSYNISWLHKTNAVIQQYHTIEQGIITQKQQ